MTSLPPKTKFPRADAIAAARQVIATLGPYCDRIIVAGSLRRRKTMVGDVEILFIPRFVQERDGLFGTIQRNQTDAAFKCLLSQRIIEKRRNSLGREMWGHSNKFSRHLASGIPIDFFTAHEDNWFNYLVCRTGSAEFNKRIATEAQAKGWKWNAYGPGFTDSTGLQVSVRSERDLFTLLQIPWLEPWQR